MKQPVRFIVMQMSSRYDIMLYSFSFALLHIYFIYFLIWNFHEIRFYLMLVVLWTSGTLCESIDHPFYANNESVRHQINAVRNIARHTHLNAIISIAIQHHMIMRHQQQRQRYQLQARVMASGKRYALPHYLNPPPLSTTPSILALFHSWHIVCPTVNTC